MKSILSSFVIMAFLCLCSIAHASGTGDPDKDLEEALDLFGGFERTININLLKNAIKEGADVNARSDRGTSPFHGIVGRGDQMWFDLYIKNGADVNAPGGTGAFPPEAV
ncbi:MAG: hypothetical protein KBA61_00865 [Spirochaetes bacterium]|nr:hypothetical protein [Spirochaetota bacterium]